MKQLLKIIKSNLPKHPEVKKEDPKPEPKSEPKPPEMKHYKKYQSFYKTETGEFKEGLLVRSLSKKNALELLEFVYDTFYVEKVK